MNVVGKGVDIQEKKQYQTIEKDENNNGYEMVEQLSNVESL